MNLFESVTKKMGRKKLERQYGKCVCDGVFSSGQTLTIIGVSSIPDGLNCENVKVLVIKDGVGYVNLGKFVNLKTLYIGPDVFDINFSQLLKCSKLQNIFVDVQNKYYSSDRGVLFDKKKKTLVRYPESSFDETYKVPESVEVLGPCAFMFAKHLKELYLPKKKLLVLSRAFNNCDQLAKIDYYGVGNEDGINVSQDEIVTNPAENTANFSN